jgi:undecaprenyl-diphosphatase
MSLLEAIVLGVVQGVTEFLPISSTGHLRIVPAFAGWEDPGAAFTAVTQLGTLAAVLLFFRHDLTRIVSGWLAGLRSRERRRELDSRIGWYLILATVPIVVFGVLLSDQIESGARSLYLIGTTMIALGLVLLLAEHVGSKRRPLEAVETRDGIVVGLAQAAALVPGVSRSGATISAGLFLGLERQAAARFSFLLSVPAVLLSGIYELRVFVHGSAPEIGATQLVVATVTAAVVGYLSIAFLLRFLATHSTLVFVVYRVVLGTLVLSLTATGRIA